MTIMEWTKGMLEENGLWPQEAEAVVAAMSDELTMKAMACRWDDPVDDYPPHIFAVIGISAKRQALEWIDRNKPEHFARPMFTF